MGVTIVSGASTVTLSSRIWSWNSNMQVIGSSASVSDIGGGNLYNPDYVWRTQRSVRTVVGFLANNIAQVPLHGFQLEADGDRARVPDSSKLAKALKSPHPSSTPFEFMRQLVIDRSLWDRYAALKVETGDGVELVRLPPRRWRFRRDVTDLPTAVVWQRADGSAVEYSLDMLLWTDAYSTGAEATPMDALFDLLTEQDESGKYRTELWQNGARLPGWIERPMDSPPWSRLARDNFRTGWQEYASGGTRVGRSPILEDGMKYHEATNGVTPEAAQQIESRKLSIAEVAAAFHIPPVFVGLLDDANYANVSAYRESLYADVLGPDFQSIQQAYNARFVADVAEPGQFVEFNTAEKLRMAFEEQAKIFQTSTGGPIMTRNEARKRINLPRIDGADELIVPLNVLTGGQASPTDSAPDDTSTGGGASAAADKAATRQLSVAEVIQKVYLGVGKVITADEARQIINAAAGELGVPGPDFAPPAPQGGAS